MTSRRQLERAIAHVATLLSQQHRTMRRDRDIYFATCDELLERGLERDALLTENALLRADIDGLESVIHELVEDRMTVRYFGRVFRKEFVAHGVTIDELRSRLEVEEVRANAYRQERDDARQTLGLVRLECQRLHEATESDLRTITKLRRAIRLMLAGASTRDLRRKLKAIAEGVMKS